MGNLDRFENPSGRPFKAASEGLLRFPSTPPSTTTRGHGAALDLVYQAAEVIQGIENHANEAEKSFANALQTLQLAEKRIRELEKGLQSAQACISEARVTIKELDEALKIERSRLEAAEMRARTAEAQAKENANTVTRVQEAIRSLILAKRPPVNKRTSAA